MRNIVYRRLLGAQLLSLGGTGLTTVALALLAWDLAGEAAGTVLGTALALKMVAYVGVSQLATALFGDLPRRGVLVGLDIARAAMVLLLPFATAIWHVYLLVFLFQSCSAAFTPIFQATIPDVLEDERDYTRALSFSRLAYDLESLASPILAALLLTLMRFDGLFVLTTLGFLASAGLVASVRLPPGQAEPTTGPAWARASRSARTYLSTPPLRGMLALNLTVSAAGSMIIVNTVIYAKAILGGSETLYVLMLACYGLGSMIVALSLRAILDQVPLRPVMFTGGAVLVTAAAIGASEPGRAAAVVLWFVIGAGASLVLTASGLLLRRMSTSHTRQLVFTGQFALSHATWLVTYPLAGLAGAAFGIGATFLLMAMIGALGLVLAWWQWRPTDELPLEHDHPQLTHDHLHTHDAHHRHPHQGWEGPEPHSHPHRHGPLRHAHAMAIDMHHPRWPKR